MRQHLNEHRHKVSSNAVSASSFDFEQDMTSGGSEIADIRRQVTKQKSTQ